MTEEEMLLRDAWTLLNQVEKEQMPVMWRAVRATWILRYQDYAKKAVG